MLINATDSHMSLLLFWNLENGLSFGPDRTQKPIHSRRLIGSHLEGFMNEASGHIAFAVRNRQVIGVLAWLTFSYSLSFGAWPLGWCCLYTVWALPLQLTFSGNALRASLLFVS